jgi:primosomal protein N' (replication factor Y)
LSAQLTAAEGPARVLRVALDVPRSAHAAAGDSSPATDILFDYRWLGAALAGQRAVVPWGRQIVIGLVVEVSAHSDISPERLRDAIAVLDDVSPLGDDWLKLIQFAAHYYQRGLGEVALPALPALLRRATGYRETNGVLESRSIKSLRKKLTALPAASGQPTGIAPELTREQQKATEILSNALSHSGQFACFLLHGVTGSGKTEVYLAAMQRAFALGRQVLVLVPEINLTPQLEDTFRARFGNASITTLNSSMADGARALNWLAAHEGQADLLLGTRMAVLASLPRLGLIVVDEEHDASFKQQEGLRYSARDLAVMRAQQLGIPVVLGSATPSLESWWQAERGRYTRLTLSHRAGAATSLPQVRLISTERVKLEHGFTEQMRHALSERMERGEQSLVFVNRRGYAPVLSCPACAWVSDCARCSAHAVFHRSDAQMHCHHCGWQARVPRACPTCGNLDLAPLGRGTQRVEEALAGWFPDARIARIDRDSTRKQGSARSLFDSVHAGDVDILVGTQMVAKGHDFRNLTLVGVIEADTALFSHDFRAAERLFSNLMQVAGRAGRADKPGEVLIQTRFLTHPLYAALVAHDYARFAREQLAERKFALLPPFSYQALLRAEARTLKDALAFIAAARELAAESAERLNVTLYDPVPMNLVRLANVERAQLLLEALARPALQTFLASWVGALYQLKPRLSWHVEVDPSDI